MMFFLVQNVFTNGIHVRTAVRKSPISRLPIEFEIRKAVVGNVFICRFFDVPNKVRQSLSGIQTDKNVNVVRHTTNGKQFMSTFLNDACGVFEQIFFPIRLNQGLSVFYRKNSLDVKLRKYVCHVER